MMNISTSRPGDTRAMLSTLWIFVLLNVIFRDIHELFRPGLVAEMMTGTVNGVQMSEGLLLQAAFMIEIPLAMVVLTRMMGYRLNRWVNAIAAVVMAVSVIGAEKFDLDDLFFAAVEVSALVFIVWYVWRWQAPLQEHGTGHHRSGEIE